MDMYQNYFQDHEAYGMDVKGASSQEIKEMDRRFGKHITPNDKILEIGTGLGDFASYCLHRGVKEYTGIEIDEGLTDKLGKKFNNYKILCVDALDFFQNTTEKFDVIYMSHVFEHFTIEEGIVLARYICEHLAHQGTWINIMPNAGCITGCLGRYSDITHKTIYSSNSFNQVLLRAGFTKNKIHHFNMFPHGFVKKMLTKLLGKFLGVEYSSFQLLTIIKK